MEKIDFLFIIYSLYEMLETQLTLIYIKKL